MWELPAFAMLRRIEDVREKDSRGWHAGEGGFSGGWALWLEFRGRKAYLTHFMTLFRASPSAS